MDTKLAKSENAVTVLDMTVLLRLVTPCRPWRESVRWIQEEKDREEEGVRVLASWQRRSAREAMKPQELKARPVDYPESGPVHYRSSGGKPTAESDVSRDLMVGSIDTLKLRYQDRPDVYVTGNLFFYFEEGNPEAVIAPDLMVVFGVSKEPRRSYKLWVEKKVPAVTVEFTSESSYREDLGNKRAVYEELGVQEYFVFDSTGKKLAPPLRGFRLRNGAFEVFLPERRGESWVLACEVLGLELHAQGDVLHWIDSKTGRRLPTPAEAGRQQAEAERERAEAERERAEAERERAEAERERADRAERELARLREELARDRKPLAGPGIPD
jgi:Uma2 family endonuclease